MPIETSTMSGVERRADLCLFRLFDESYDLAVLRNFDHAKLRNLMRLNRQGSQRNVRARFAMLLLHQRVVHLVNVIAGKDEHVLRFFRADRVNILKHRIGRALVPAFRHALHRRQNLDEFAEFRRHHRSPAFADVPVQRERLVLRKDVNMPQVGVDASLKA